MEYDDFQRAAITHINNNCSVLVSAPTGSGKTAIAEYVINECLNKNNKAVYTAPIKALSNQKYREFNKLFPHKIGILTGDVTINPSAQILIMTTEIFRNKVLEETDSLNEYSWIIFDEIHYLDDYERGTVWEESLIFLPAHMRVLALSATIPNISNFAEWLSKIHKSKFKIVIEAKRPVPLHFFYQCQGEIVDNLSLIKKHCYSYAGYRNKKHFLHHLKPNRLDTLVKHLADTNRLPAIYFTFSRRRCEYLALELTGFMLLNNEETERITEIYTKLCESFNLQDEESAKKLYPLIKSGIAYHHAGMLPTLKEVVERLFTSRLIKLIFTTETFALGINMPAKTVVFDELRKFYGQYFGALKTRDFFQMAGRAGRRGIDEEGYVYSRVNPRFLMFDELKKIIFSEPEKISSRFNASYATLITLYANYKEQLYNIYENSFHYFEEKKHSRKKALELIRSKISLLKEFGHIKNNNVTEKGIFASKIYGYELPFSELFEKKILDTLSVKELALLCLAVVFEPRKNIVAARPHRNIRKIQKTADDIAAPIRKKERLYKIRPLSKKYYFDLSESLLCWMDQKPFPYILQYTEVDEGEIIRYFRMAIQILREILDTPASNELKTNAKDAIYLINHGIIDAKKQLEQ